MNCKYYSPEQQKTAKKIVDLYSRFNVKIGNLISITEGKRVSRYEFELYPDTVVSKITKFRDDISLMLSVPKVRIICPLPNKTAFAIEVASNTEKIVQFDEVLKSSELKNSADKLCVALGKNLSNESVCINLARAPHLLIGGKANSGKTTLIKSIICSLVLSYSPAEAKILLITPKVDEYKSIENSRHLFSPIISDCREALDALNTLLEECEGRLKLFAEHSVKDITSYNNCSNKKLHRIVAIIDEFSLLTEYKPRDFEAIICRLALYGRVAGIHLIPATKQLNPKTVTGIIKANIPKRIALSTNNAMESRTIMDACDAECLLSKGDLLLCDSINQPQRIQAPYITDEEIAEIINS